MNAPQAVGQLDRTTYLGGSDVAAILGVSPWTTPFMLFQKKTGAYVEEITPTKRRILERGARCEPDDDDTPSTADRREACAVIRDWLTEAESALMRGDLKRHFECLQEGLDVLTSLRGLEQ